MKAARGNMASLGRTRKAKEQHQLAELCAKEFLGKGSRQTDRQTDFLLQADPGDK